MKSNMSMPANCTHIVASSIITCVADGDESVASVIVLSESARSSPDVAVGSVDDGAVRHCTLSVRR